MQDSTNATSLLEVTPQVLDAVARRLDGGSRSALACCFAAAAYDQCLASVIQYAKEAQRGKETFKLWPVAMTVVSKDIVFWQKCCFGGHFSAAQWLTDATSLRGKERFGLTVEDARVDNNYVLRRTCCNGHLSTAQWLTERFGLTAEDARADDNYALQRTCCNGHLSIAQWLVERLDKYGESAISGDPNIFVFCANLETPAGKELSILTSA